MDKQKIRDRINELESKREEYVEIIKGHSPTLIALAAIIISVIFYNLEKGNYIIASTTSIILSASIIFFSNLYSYSNSKNKKIKEKIQKNYDLLLDREQ